MAQIACRGIRGATTADNNDRESIIDATPLGYIGEPEEVSELALFLASKKTFSIRFVPLLSFFLLPFFPNFFANFLSFPSTMETIHAVLFLNFIR